MSGSDVLVLAPWAAFGAGVLFICFRLLFLRHQAPRSPPLPPAKSSAPPGTGPARTSLPGPGPAGTGLPGTTRPAGSVQAPMPSDREQPADRQRNTSDL